MQRIHWKNYVREKRNLRTPNIQIGSFYNSANDAGTIFRSVPAAYKRGCILFVQEAIYTG